MRWEDTKDLPTWTEVLEKTDDYEITVDHDKYVITNQSPEQVEKQYANVIGFYKLAEYPKGCKYMDNMQNWTAYLGDVHIYHLPNGTGLMDIIVCDKQEYITQPLFFTLEEEE